MRALHRPLTTGDCANFMGFTSEWIRQAITEGVPVPGHGLAKLEAEALVTERLTADGTRVRRTNYRIYPSSFRTFLRTIGWKHLPQAGPASSGGC